MYGGLNRLLAAAFVAGAFAAGAALIAAPAALACSGGPSAYNVYRECLSSGGAGGGKHSGSGGGGNSGGSQSGSTSPALSKQAKKAIAKAGNDGNALKSLYNQGGRVRFLQASHASGPASEPTAIGSAFDLGPGPTALLVVLAASAALLLGGGGMRIWRQRHRA